MAGLTPIVPIKWFFALNDAGNDFSNYCLMVQAAVRSARRHTRLEPIFIYDGVPGPLTRWMQDHGVRVVHHRTSMYDRLVEHARSSGRKQSVSTGAGAYLRLDIPVLCQTLGIDDHYVLYTDCDVMFRRDPEPELRGLQPEFFAAAPQFDPTQPADMNSGVLWMNLPRLRQMYAPFCDYIREHMDTLRQTGYDQAALRAFYGTRRRGGPAWDALPLALNWKPHWGRNDASAIVHFHGPKPTSRTLLARGASHRAHAELARDDYYRSCQEWDDYAAGLQPIDPPLVVDPASVPPRPRHPRPAPVLDPLPLEAQGFDADAYVHAYPDVARAVQTHRYHDALEHYRTAGIWEGRRQGVSAALEQTLMSRLPGARQAPCAPPARERAASRCWAALWARWPQLARPPQCLRVVGDEDFARSLQGYADCKLDLHAPDLHAPGRGKALREAPAAEAAVLQFDASEGVDPLVAILHAVAAGLPPAALIVVWTALPAVRQVAPAGVREALGSLGEVLLLQRQIGGDRKDLLVLRRPDAPR